MIDMIYNHNSNGGGRQTPDMIVIHAMSEQIQGLPASDFLELIGLSVHYLVLPNGDVMECRNPLYKAWHAKNFNENTIGIEVLVEGEYTYTDFIKKIKTRWVKPIQMKSLIQLCQNLIDDERFDISKITRHSDIDPDRKQDPGTGFNWDYFTKQIKL